MKDLIIEYSKRYNNKDFILNDPIQFPHLYKEKKDIEISAFISSWLSYGNRKQIIKTLEIIHKEFALYNNSPYQFIKEKGFVKYKNNPSCLYRFYTFNDYYNLCLTLYNIYEKYSSLEKAIEEKQKENKEGNNSIVILKIIITMFKDVKGIPNNITSACKRLCMFLRWMIRNDGIVDFGLWNILEPKDLIIPLDTHVHKEALFLQLTTIKQPSLKTALQITENLKTIFPSDPLLGDFALFGYGINKSATEPATSI
ncbi:MAG: TIGR02757 family protein [Bacteroidales bacterium]|jgi:uncharacterized protein (TIGR02757 family)|nr:TIGR02757 family protein [Bacteroidales bacterium]